MAEPTKHLVYLHGYASSPGSNKAQWLRGRLTPRGVQVHIPDLNVPDFEQLTLTAMIDKTAATVRALPPGDVYLVGSSMGGLTATHFLDTTRSAHAEAASRVRKAMLFAPAFDFMENRRRLLGEAGLAAWRDSGWLAVYHYGEDAQRRVHYGLVEDIQQYDSYSVSIDIPLLIFHGLADESVDFEQSVRFAKSRANVALRLVESDHKLTDQLEVIYAAVLDFFTF